MRKLDKKGIGGYEFITVAVVCLILSLILLSMTIKTGEKEKFDVFKLNAQKIGVNSTDYSDKESGVVYLYELVEDGLVGRMKNNFSGDLYCDMYESKVEFNNDGRKVTLQCGEYLIYRQNLSKKNYPIYRVGEWTYQKIDGDDVEKRVAYNIKDKKSGKYLLDEDYEKELFIKKVVSIYGDKYNDFEAIEKDFKVVKKNMYRKMILVSGVEE